MDGTTGNMTSQQISRAWSRIETWLAEHAAVTFESLPGPATLEQIASAEQRLGVAFSSELVASLRCHNGSGYFEILPVHTLLSAELITDDFLLAAEVADDPYTDVSGFEGSPKWVPFSSDAGGGHLILDVSGERHGSAVGLRDELTNITFPAGEMWSSLASLLERAATVLETMSTLDGYRPVAHEGELEWKLE